MKIEVLKPNIQHPAIQQWKKFQNSLGNYQGKIDEFYDVNFLEIIQKYQREKQLPPDGYIGNKTWLEAYKEGMVFSDSQKFEFPMKPNFSPIVAQQAKFDLFGELKFASSPTKDNPEHIVILNDFETKNIVRVELPQLNKMSNGQYKAMRFHRKGAEQLRSFFNEIEKQRLLPLLLTYGGSYNPRLIRGSKTSLSNHSFGTAFDFNMQWNALNVEPIALGLRGSVRELVPLAHEYGFYWGGHFSRKDGMHFEIAKFL